MFRSNQISLCSSISTVSYSPGRGFGESDEIREVLLLLEAQHDSTLPGLKNVQIRWDSDIALEILNGDIENVQECLVELAGKFKLETLEVPFITEKTSREITATYGTAVKVRGCLQRYRVELN